MKHKWNKYGSSASRRYGLPVLLFLLLTSCGSGIYHTVKPGQNLYRISRTYGVSEATIARANNISDPTRVRAGTRLYIPGAERVRYVPAVKPPKQRPVKVRKPVKKPVTVTKSKPKPAQQTTSAPRNKTVTSKGAKSTDVKKLQWPLRGKIIRSFSSKAKAGGGKGIEIAVRSGSPVQAAEAGKVIYSGDGVNGYGHLIILQHENDLFTVYGFNQRNYARQGDFVSKGEKIALSGIPPAGGTPRLHFEVRKGKQAVNPILYLP
jgi:lipoprotein NlpD